MQRRDYLKEVYELVELLSKSGQNVSIATLNHPLGLRNGKTLPWTTVFVVVSEQAKPHLLIPKRMKFAF